MDYLAVVDQVIELLRSRGRVSYRALRVQLHLDDEAIEALKEELIYAQQVAMDEDGRVLVWTGEAGITPEPARQPSIPLSPDTAEYTELSWSTSWKRTYMLAENTHRSRQEIALWPSTAPLARYGNCLPDIAATDL